MTDTPDPIQNRKTLLRALRDAIQYLIHVALIPIIALLKMLDAGVQHLLAELGKF